jgi:gas vesicle protein
MDDFYDRQESSGGGFMAGLFTGALLGAGLGLLLAPKAGSELRRQLKMRAGDLADTAEEGYRRAADTVNDLSGRGRDLADRGREMGRDIYDRARDVAGKATDEGQRFARDVASNVSDATERH